VPHESKRLAQDDSRNRKSNLRPANQCPVHRVTYRNIGGWKTSKNIYGKQAAGCSEIWSGGRYHPCGATAWCEEEEWIVKICEIVTRLVEERRGVAADCILSPLLSASRKKTGCLGGPRELLCWKRQSDGRHTHTHTYLCDVDFAPVGHPGSVLRQITSTAEALAS